MAKELQIRCLDLGVDHDGFVSGTSIDDFVACVEKQFAEITGDDTGLSESKRDLVKSAIKQASRPAKFRSNTLAALIS